MPATVLSATLTSGSATSSATEFEPGPVAFAITVTGFTGSVTLQASPDGTTFYNVADGTFTASESKGTYSHEGGFLRFTSSISGGSAACVAWQGMRIG